jgi:hypothetical protein
VITDGLILSMIVVSSSSEGKTLHSQSQPYGLNLSQEGSTSSVLAFSVRTTTKQNKPQQIPVSTHHEFGVGHDDVARIKDAVTALGGSPFPCALHHSSSRCTQHSPR